MIEITLDDREVQARLRQLQQHLGNLRPAMAQIGEALKISTQARFRTSTAPDGTPWAPNSAVTLALYLNKTAGNRKKDGTLSKKGQARMAGKKPLVDSGLLRDTISWQAGSDWVSVGTNRFANVTPHGAAIHQFGGQAGRGRKVTIPARPFLGFSEADKAGILAILSAYLDNAAKG